MGLPTADEQAAWKELELFATQEGTAESERLLRELEGMAAQAAGQKVQDERKEAPPPSTKASGKVVKKGAPTRSR